MADDDGGNRVVVIDDMAGSGGVDGLVGVSSWGAVCVVVLEVGIEVVWVPNLMCGRLGII
jgi:hypothetical protein